MNSSINYKVALWSIKNSFLPHPPPVQLFLSIPNYIATSLFKYYIYIVVAHNSTYGRIFRKIYVICNLRRNSNGIQMCRYIQNNWCPTMLRWSLGAVAVALFIVRLWELLEVIIMVSRLYKHVISLYGYKISHIALRTHNTIIRTWY